MLDTLLLHPEFTMASTQGKEENSFFFTIKGVNNSRVWRYMLEVNEKNTEYLKTDIILSNKSLQPWCGQTHHPRM